MYILHDMLYSTRSTRDYCRLATTATSITISGGVPSGSVTNSYEVMWATTNIGGCSGDSDTGSTTINSGSITSYEIMGLEEDSRYSITVTASNSAGNSGSNTSCHWR